MVSTVNSTIHIKNEKEESVLTTIEKFRTVQDIPIENLDFRHVGTDKIELTLKYPLDAFDKTVTHFLSVLYGELPYMKGFGSLRFVELEVPNEVYSWFAGPQFGVDGIQSRFHCTQSPFLMSVIKPSVDPTATRETQVSKFVGPLEAGFHGVKDDEMLGSFNRLSVWDRIELATQNFGYIPAVNLDQLTDFERIVSDKRVSMIIVNASILGFPLLNQIRRVSRIPILSHLSLQGSFNNTFSPSLYAFLHRLFGCDAFITAIGDNGYYIASKACELAMTKCLTDPLPIRKTLPLLAGGARLHNIHNIMEPYEQGAIPYGLVFGSLIYNSDESPKVMAKQVKDIVLQTKKALARQRR